MSHFIFPYSGNKRKEINEIFSVLDFSMDTIVEPFCGTSVISFEIYKKFPDKKFYLNDNSCQLIKVYELLKSSDISSIENEINKIISQVENKDDFLNVYESYKKDNDIFKYIYFQKYSSMARMGFFQIRDNRGTKNISVFKFSKLNIEFINFLKSPNVFINCGDWYDTYKKFYDNKNCCIIMDPPYILSCNQFYDSPVSNIYEYFSDPRDYICKIYFIVEDMWINKLLFKNFKSKKYNKMYSITKKKTLHVIYHN